jgi:hypothetical protein
MVSAAGPTVVPVVRARWWAAERSPERFHAPVSARRAAALALRVAPMASMAAAASTASPAWAPDSRAGSKRAA